MWHTLADSVNRYNVHLHSPCSEHFLFRQEQAPGSLCVDDIFCPTIHSWILLSLQWCQITGYIFYYLQQKTRTNGSSPWIPVVRSQRCHKCPHTAFKKYLNTVLYYLEVNQWSQFSFMIRLFWWIIFLEVNAVNQVIMWAPAYFVTGYLKL